MPEMSTNASYEKLLNIDRNRYMTINANMHGLPPETVQKVQAAVEAFTLELHVLLTEG